MGLMNASIIIIGLEFLMLSLYAYLFVTTSIDTSWILLIFMVAIASLIIATLEYRKTMVLETEINLKYSKIFAKVSEGIIIMLFFMGVALGFLLLIARIKLFIMH